VTEPAQQPPQAGSEHSALRIVGDDLLALHEPVRSKCVDQCRAIRQWMSAVLARLRPGQVALQMQIVRAGDVAARIGLFAGVGVCQIEAAVKNEHAFGGACQPFGKVDGQNQRRVMGVRHDDPRWTTNFVETPVVVLSV
jgi:hypothetical protein